MTPIPIKERETEQYALEQPDMIRVNISTGNIVTDRRIEYFGIHAPAKGATNRGLR